MFAFGIFLHHDVQAAEGLLSFLHNDQDIFFVHVDQSAEDLFRPFADKFSTMPNVHFVPSIRCQWGHWSLVEAELNLLRYAAGVPGWRVYLNLSGNDFPVKNRVALLSLDKRTNYVSSMPLENMPPKFQDRINYRHDIVDAKVVARHYRLNLPQLCRWVGSQWHILSRGFCEWVVGAELAEDLAGELRDAAVPDEYFFQAALLNGPFAPSHDSNPRRFILWEAGAANPSTITRREAETALSHPGYLFARKFITGPSDGATAFIKQRLKRFA